MVSKHHAGDQPNQGTMNKTDEHDSNKERTHKISRRPLLKTAAAGLATGLAGCSSDDGGEKTGGQQTTAAGNGNDHSGVSFNFNEIEYVNAGRFAKKAIENWGLKFENNTGATVNLNFPEEEGLLTSFKNNNPPHILTGDPDIPGQLLSEGLVQGYNESWSEKWPDYHEQLLDSHTESVEWIWENWDDEYSLLASGHPSSGFITRKDHWENSPLSWDRFPPKNYDDFVEIATTLRDSNDQSLGFQPIGGGCDVLDVYGWQWAQTMDPSDDGYGGTNFSRDWNRSNWDNEAYNEFMTKNVELYTKHGLGNDSTPVICDEPTYAMLATGKLSIAHAPFQAQSAFLERFPELLEDGTLQWGSSFTEDQPIHGFESNTMFEFASLPKGKDESTWDRSMAAAYDFLDFGLNQTQTFSHDLTTGVGTPPAWEEPYNNVPDNDFTTAGGWKSTIQHMTDNSERMLTASAHPLQGVYADVFASNTVDSWKGNKPVSQGLQDAADEMNNRIEQSNKPWQN